MCTNLPHETLKRAGTHYCVFVIQAGPACSKQTSWHPACRSVRLCPSARTPARKTNQRPMCGKGDGESNHTLLPWPWGKRLLNILWDYACVCVGGGEGYLYIYSTFLRTPQDNLPVIFPFCYDIWTLLQSAAGLLCLSQNCMVSREKHIVCLYHRRTPLRYGRLLPGCIKHVLTDPIERTIKSQTFLQKNLVQHSCLGKDSFHQTNLELLSCMTCQFWTC